MPISSRFVVRSTIGLLAIGFLALFGIVVATIWLGHDLRSISTMLSRRATCARGGRAARYRANAESSQRGYLLTGNEIYLAPYDTARAQWRCGSSMP